MPKATEGTGLGGWLQEGEVDLLFGIVLLDARLGRDRAVF